MPLEMEGDMFPELWIPSSASSWSERSRQASLEIDAAIMLKHRQAAEAMMALRIMTTVAAGERDPERLKHLALQTVDGRPVDLRGVDPGSSAAA